MSLRIRAAWISLARACRSPDDKDLVSTRIVVGANREIMRFSSALAPISVLTAATPADTKSDTVVEEIIARVDNHIITHSDYSRSQEQVRSEAQQQGMPSQELGEREKDVLRDLIDQQLLVEKG